ncbi:DNA adenine methylase [Photobacterium damselae]|uniref:DNA adenine methylase n=1 Tax=Photobacterium damselae TaxID=38293 RepID=UPI0040677745
MNNSKEPITLEPISATTSPLRWAGSKRFIASEIKTIMKYTNNDTLIEVFGGSLALTIAIQPRKSIVNDILSPLTNLFERIKCGELKSISELIDTTNTNENFLTNRQLFNDINRSDINSTVEEAALFYFLNRTCYNGLCRFSLKTGFNVGWGKLKKPLLLDNFEEIMCALKNTEIHNKSYVDFSTSLKGFVVLDPPYFGVFTDYSAYKFTESDQQRLSDLYKDSSNPVMAFNSDHNVILNIYKENGYDVYTFDAPRSISCNGNRDSVREMLAVKNIDHNLIMTVFKDKNIKLIS